MRCLFLIALLSLCLSLTFAQDVQVQYVACDGGKAVDVNSPGLHAELLDLGIVANKVQDRVALIKQVLEQIRDKPTNPVCYAVRITNNSGVTLPLTLDSVSLATGKWAETDADFSSPTLVKASPVSEWAGDKSLFARGKEIANGQSFTGVVFFEMPIEQTAVGGGMPGGGPGMPGFAGGPPGAPGGGTGALAPQEPPRRVQYTPADRKIKVAEPVFADRLLKELDLDLTLTGSVSAPAGKQRIFPGQGNVDDETPLRVGTPGVLKPAPPKPVVATVNLVGEVTVAAAAGGLPGGLPGMPGGGMPGMPGGMPGGAATSGAPAGMPTMPGGMPGMPGAMPGTPAPGGAPGAMPTVPGAMPGVPGGRPGALQAVPGALPTTPGATPAAQPGAVAPGGTPPPATVAPPATGAAPGGDTTPPVGGKRPRRPGAAPTG